MNKRGTFNKNTSAKRSFDSKGKSAWNENKFSKTAKHSDIRQSSTQRGLDNKRGANDKKFNNRHSNFSAQRDFAVKKISRYIRNMNETQNFDSRDNFVDDNIIIGRNAVSEALKAGRSINRLLVADGSREGSIQKIVAMAKDNGIIIETVTRDKLDKLSNGQRHQGVLAYASPVEYATLDDILKIAEERNEQPFILLLDELEDPHNFGAILRTADAVGVHGVLIPKRRSVSLNSTVAKTSAGAIEYVKVAQINNVSQTLQQLKDLDFTIIGSDVDNGEVYDKADFNEAIVLVIGGEGKGLRRLTKDNCDVIVKIPMNGKINSLNASVAGAILMYEAFRQRRTM